MIRLRHILHPVRSARSASRRIGEFIFRYQARQKFKNVRRGHRERCWCGGELQEFRWHASYGVCAECRSYVNRRPPLPEELTRIYSFDLYWHTRMRLKGFPEIEQRPANDRADGRVEYWLKLVERHGPRQGRVIEIGAAHGVMLTELRDRGYECIGVEPDEQTAAWVRKNSSLDIRAGFFPGIDLPKCDVFLAFDVIEHSTDPEAFLKGAAGILEPGGIAILQTPIDRNGTQPPFGSRCHEVFDDIEHLHIFSDASLRKMAEAAQLEVAATEDGWMLAHEVVVLQKPRI